VGGMVEGRYEWMRGKRGADPKLRERQGAIEEETSLAQPILQVKIPGSDFNEEVLSPLSILQRPPSVNRAMTLVFLLSDWGGFIAADGALLTSLTPALDIGKQSHGRVGARSDFHFRVSGAGRGIHWTSP